MIATVFLLAVVLFITTVNKVSAFNQISVTGATLPFGWKTTPFENAQEGNPTGQPFLDWYPTASDADDTAEVNNLALVLNYLIIGGTYVIGSFLIVAGVRLGKRKLTA